MRLFDGTPGAPAASHRGGSTTAEVARLLHAEPDVPGLALLLDDDVLTGWVGDHLGPVAASAGAQRDYLRFKPGAGGVARVRLGARGGDLLLALWHRDGAPKLHKTLQRSGAAVVVVDEPMLALLAHPAADRDLPGLGRLHGRGAAATLQRLTPSDEGARRVLREVADTAGGWRTLAWKPQRRWVGLLGEEVPPGHEPGPVDGPGAGQVVLRAYRPRVARHAVDRYAAVAPLLPGALPLLLGRDDRRGLVAVQHIPGAGLDERLAHLRDQGQDAGDELRRAGDLVARLHDVAAAPLPPHASTTWQDEADRVRAAAALVDVLLPDAAAGHLAEELALALPRLRDRLPVLVHGDLSADQVVLRPDGQAALIDLDEATFAPASVDLACAAAAWWTSDPGTAADRTTRLHEGYLGRRPLPDADSLRVRTAAHLLRRAAEPFRTGSPCWPQQVRDCVAAARAALRGCLPAGAP